MRGLDEEFDDVRERQKAPVGLIVFVLCFTVLLGPSLLVWIIRAVALAGQCAPGPDLCRGMTLGGGLRDALLLAWGVGTDTLLVLVLSTIVAVACFTTRRILSGVLCLLLLPILPSLLPMLAVFVTKFDGCEISADGVGNCTLWGADMGRSFHIAAAVPDMIYGFVPYSFALALMISVVGWFLARPKTQAPPAMHATARIRRFDDDAI
ncbi:MAG TPA: hypothetical protein VHE09_00145 [Rhizomicrobium sp.]|jgi:hypothetical protein|nr:hypothetical protein [Rhizomicrobium sp.]